MIGLALGLAGIAALCNATGDLALLGSAAGVALLVVGVVLLARSPVLENHGTDADTPEGPGGVGSPADREEPARRR